VTGSIPYAKATSGEKARGEITKLLRSMGCDEITFQDRFSEGVLVVAFRIRGSIYKLEASARGWARWWLRHNPHSSRHRTSKAQHEAKALDQGLIAINSVLRDYVRGMVTAIECNALSIEQAMLGHRLLGNGQTVMDHLVDTKLLSLPAPLSNDGSAG
jgi:hypothetical protein